MKSFVLLCALCVFFASFACAPANADEFEGAKKNLPSLVMLSTPT